MTMTVPMVETLINNKWKLLLPEHRAARAEWGEWLDDKGGFHTGWEVERLASLHKNVGSDDVVFDIGAEEADISALISTWIGHGDGGIVLFEPNPLVWANAYAIWNANNLKSPLAFVEGFAGDYNRHLDLLDIDNWPESAHGPVIADHAFCQLNERPDLPAIRIDDFVGMCGYQPSVLHIDCEGSELHVLEGAIDTLREAMPLCYVSVHETFMREQYDQNPQELFDYMGRLGYRSKLLAVDHEAHYCFWNPFGRELRL